MEKNKGISLDKHCSIDAQGKICFTSFPTHFVSHGHTDHLPSRVTNKSFICSDVTKKLLTHRVKRKGRFQFQDPYPFQLLPSGHTLGSMMLFDEDNSILYTGDLQTNNCYCGKAQPMDCKILIIESTFGLPRYQFPQREKVYREIVQFVKAHDGVIFDAYSFGKAQELCMLFEKRKIPFSVSENVKKINTLLGLTFRYETYDASVIVGRVEKDGWVTVGCSGWAISDSFQYQFLYDHGFVLSNHADYPALVRFVRRCNPEVVYTFHGFHVEFAESLRKEGFSAYPLMKKQMLLRSFV